MGMCELYAQAHTLEWTQEKLFYASPVYRIACTTALLRSCCSRTECSADPRHCPAASRGGFGCPDRRQDQGKARQVENRERWVQVPRPARCCDVGRYYWCHAAQGFGYSHGEDRGGDASR